MDGEGDDESSHKSKDLLTNDPEVLKNVSRSHIPTHRPAHQLWLHAALMCGRDFLYAVEVVLVTPIMLQLGMPEDLYSYIWFISPSFGLLLGPLIGNWSDKCGLRWGRRRPFILSFVLGTIIALTLLIFSKDLASAFSSYPNDQRILGLVFGIIGTQIMDFCLDQLEAPLRAFTLDVCSPADQQKAFTLQTLAMGTGAALGFIIDGVKWETIFGVDMPGLQIKVVYIFAMIVYIITAVMTLFSIQEVQWKKPKKLSTKEDPKHCDKEEVKNSKYASNNAKVLLRCHTTAGFHRSSAIRSITLLPRISLCKSVFLAMSCPEGLNDIVTSQSNDTSTSTVAEDESSDNESDDETGDEICGLSLPNLSQNNTNSTSSIFKRKNMSCSTTESMHFEQNHIRENGHKSSRLESSNKNTASEGENTESTEFLPHANTENNKNIQFQNQSFITSDTKNRNQNPNLTTKPDSHHANMTNGDLNGNGVVRKLEFNETPIFIDAVQHSDERRSKEKRRNKSKKKKEKLKKDEDEMKPVSTRLLWLSIVTMPMKLRYLCFSLLISFIGIEVLLLWYTNIFGRVVYGGDPMAPENSTELQLYNDGVHMGCWGLTIYAVAVMIFSVAMEHFDILSKVSMRLLYSGGQLATALSTAVMFFFPTEAVILSLSWTIGITVSTSLTIPYVLVGKYHQEKEFVMKSPGATKRGYGTDCAILACQMYAGNLLYAAISGPVISSYGGVKIMLLVASICHMMAFVICVWLVTYPGERSFKFCNRKARTDISNY